MALCSARTLQVKSNQSGDWYEVPLVEGSIVINVGDMMQEMAELAPDEVAMRDERVIVSDEQARGGEHE